MKIYVRDYISKIVKKMQFEGPNSVVLNVITRQILRKLLGITSIFLFTPFIVIALAFLCIYRHLIEIILKIQFKDKFAGLLKGTDCIWAIEDTVSLSVINILMILEKTTQNTNAEIFLQDLRKLINDCILSKTADTTLEKLFYHRSQKFGYYFWERNDEVDLEYRIRWLECEDINCDGSCEDVTSEIFRRNLGSICNRPLPDDHTAAWEILVGRHCAQFSSHLQYAEEDHLSVKKRSNADTLKIPVIFRVHHSLGDGMALLDLLLKAVAEEDEAKVTKLTKIEDNIGSIIKNEKDFKDLKEIVSLSHNLRNNFHSEAEIVQSYHENILTASMPFTYVTSRTLRDLRRFFRQSFKFFDSVTIDSMKQQMKASIEYMWLNFKDTVLNQSYEKIKDVVRLIFFILSIPECFIQQAICSMDEKYVTYLI